LYCTLTVSRFSFFFPIYTIGRTPWTGDRPVARPLYLNTGQHKHRINIHTSNIHTLSWIRTHDHGVRASEDSSCLRPLGYCDRRTPWNLPLMIILSPTPHSLDTDSVVKQQKNWCDFDVCMATTILHVLSTLRNPLKETEISEAIHKQRQIAYRQRVRFSTSQLVFLHIKLLTELYPPEHTDPWNVICRRLKWQMKGELAFLHQKLSPASGVPSHSLFHLYTKPDLKEFIFVISSASSLYSVVW
jgi:hypothetical protein